jgi:hypothetical protein
MKFVQNSLSKIAAGFVIGAVAVILCYKLIGLWNHNEESEEARYVCTHINMMSIGLALYDYDETNTAPGPITLETLVRAQKLPEWSERYICPGQLGIIPSRIPWEEPSKANPLSPPKIAALYSQCPYYIETFSNEFRIRCQYHSNELKDSFPRKIKIGQ